MKSELTILKKLREVIAEEINNYLEEDEETIGMLDELSLDNVKIDYPNTDNMPKSTMIYIEPENESIEVLSNQSDLASFNVTVYVLVKNDNSENLIKKVFGYSTAIYSLLKNNQTLDGVVDFITADNLIYYPAVEANAGIKAVELSVNIDWSKDWF